MELIILLLIFFLLYPVIKAGLKIWLQMRQLKKKFQNTQRQYGNNRQNYSNQSTRKRHHQGKIFSRSDGEYVDFEEIIENRQSVQYVEIHDAEPRITDVKFEDL